MNSLKSTIAPSLRRAEFLPPEEYGSMSYPFQLMRAMHARIEQHWRGPEVHSEISTRSTGTVHPVKAQTYESYECKTVVWYGKTYVFTTGQAAAVSILWKAWKAGKPNVGAGRILECYGGYADRVRDIFKKRRNEMHPAWKEMICHEKDQFFLREPTDR